MSKKIVVVILILVSLAFVAFHRMVPSEKSVQLEATVVSGPYDPIVVLELFTSQGCSSCPPADVLLEKVIQKQDNGIIALSYHVDYWNYIGWSDPFSKPEYTKRQRAYNHKFNSRGNYTPQLVINGREHFVGSHSGKLYTGIDKYGKQKTENAIAISRVDNNLGALTFSYDAKGDLADKQIRALLVLDRRETQVKRGENQNRRLSNSNIVVAQKLIEPVGNRGDGSLSIPKIVKKDEKAKLILLIQDKDLAITAASSKAL
ncbi:MAG: DUF1223 domain-containing protein [Bacteroidota bacterium]